MGEKKVACIIFMKSLTENYLEFLCVEVVEILKYILYKYTGSVRNGLTWLVIGENGGMLWYLGFHKMQGIC
jgi:hypothetical protein